MLTATPPSRSSNLYNGFYYAHCCGRPYRRSPEWEAFFGGIADRIVSQLRPTTVLDAGCAKGFLVEALRDRGVEAYGIDISGTAIDEVRPDIRPYCRVGSLTDPLPRT
ncbi:MAG: methyltransferase domain-containing protein, partial [Gemmataceae bacterium]